MEVIAKKNNECILPSAFGTAILCLMVGGVIVAMACEPTSAIALAFVMIIGAVLLIICICSVIDIARAPKLAITYENGKLRFADGYECPLNDVIKINYKCAQSRLICYTWGELIVQVDEREIRYKYITDVAAVHDRILELMLQSREKDND